VNDAALTAAAVTYTAERFVAVSPGGFSIDSGTQIGIVRNFGGVSQGATSGPGVIIPGSSFPLSDFLTDGIQGLELGTGIYNLPPSTLSFPVQLLNAGAITDAVPDIVSTQIGQPSGTDLFYFVDNLGNRVGNIVSVVFSAIPLVGQANMAIYYAETRTLQYASLIRDLRIQTFNLSDFGITAGNMGQVAAFVQKLSGASDMAFVAYNENAITPAPAINITKTSSTAAALAAGNPVTYTITVTNTGTKTVNSVTVSDTWPAILTGASWTCTGSGGAACPAASGGGTSLNQTIAPLPAGSAVTYTITGTVGANPPASIANVAAVDAADAVCTDASGAPTGDPPCLATATNPSLPIFSIVKTASTTAAVAPGGQITYTITASNSGTIDATQVVVADGLPAGIASATWTCTGTGATCAHASGSGGLNETLATLPAGSSVTYTLTATLAATGLPASIANFASVTSTNGGLCLDGTALPCKSTTVTNTVTTTPSNSSTVPVPALDGKAVLLLTLLLGGAAFGARRRQGERKRG
jgi:uncharacterized repeat protein (TIGR01451 family)